MAIDAYMVFIPTKSKLQTAEAIEIKGESSDFESKDKGSFEITSFEWGASAGKERDYGSSKGNATGAPGQPAPLGRSLGGSTNENHRVVTVDDFKVTKPFDLASPGLFMACTDPKCVFEQAMIIFRKSGGGDPFVYLRFVFKEVRIDSIEWKLESAGDGGDKPDQEDLKCSFQECEIFYSPQAVTGEKEIKWGGGSAKKSASYKRDSALPKK